MERTPWWINLKDDELPIWEGKPVGCKADGGGSHRGQGLIGPMHLHRMCNLRDMDGLKKTIEGGADVNEVEAAGNTPLHCCAYEGWLEGAQLLLNHGAKVNASNNAGDRPIHWARNMGHGAVEEALKQWGSREDRGLVIVQDQVPKVKDFLAKDCWKHHPKPYLDFIEFKRRERAKMEADKNKLLPGL